MAEKVKIGDTVLWRGGWGSNAPLEAVVDGLDITDEPREKYGTPVQEAYWSDVQDNRVLFFLGAMNNLVGVMKLFIRFGKSLKC